MFLHHSVALISGRIGPTLFAEDSRLLIAILSSPFLAPILFINRIGQLCFLFTHFVGPTSTIHLSTSCFFLFELIIIYSRTRA